MPSIARHGLQATAIYSSSGLPIGSADKNFPLVSVPSCTFPTWGSVRQVASRNLPA